MKNMLDRIVISPDVSIKEALKRIDDAAMKILFVCNDKEYLIGSLTDGDIRRRLLSGGDLKEEISSCYNRSPIYVTERDYTTGSIKKLMLEQTLEVIPVVDKETKKIKKILCWNDIFKETEVSSKALDVPVVIMAGGMGKRMDPFTKVLPKPLIPLGEKTIIEVIIDNFVRSGAKDFFVTLNYMGQMVKNYFDSAKRDYNISFISEEEFLGTAGSLKLLPASLNDTFLVSNCDIIVNLDYADLVKFHRERRNALTVVGSIQHHRIPYGVISFEREGKILNIEEKPEFDFTVNTGVYVLSKEILSHIPHNTNFDMTHLIERLLNEDKRVGVYPVSQKSYTDIGNIEDYKKFTKRLA